MSTADPVTCPRCHVVAPFEQPTALHRKPAALRFSWVAEPTGLLIILAGYRSLGTFILSVGAFLMIGTLQTPVGTCRNCGAVLAVDWLGHWYSREQAERSGT